MFRVKNCKPGLLGGKMVIVGLQKELQVFFTQAFSASESKVK